MRARAAGMLMVAVVVLAAAAAAHADTAPGSIYNAVKEQVDNPERSSSAVSHLENLLGEIEDRVTAEANNTDLQWRVSEAQYVHDIEHINNTLIVVTYNRTRMDHELLNMTARLNVLKGDLDSLDSRIATRTKRIDEIEVLVSDGNTYDTKREVRFQDRTAYAKKTVEGVDNVIDALGSNSVDEVEGSLRQALNAEHTTFDEAPPNVADTNKTAGSFLEVAAQVGVKDDLDELRMLLGQLHSEMHKYMDDMATVRVKQGGQWAHEAGNLEDEAKKLKAEVDALEATRAPNDAELEQLKDRYANVSLARIDVNNAVVAAKARLDNKVRGLQLLRSEHQSEQSAREGQIRTVTELQRALEKHDGDTPAQLRAVAASGAGAGSAEEQRLKRIKAALTSKPQTSGTVAVPSEGSAAQQTEKAVARQ